MYNQLSRYKCFINIYHIATDRRPLHSCVELVSCDHSPRLFGRSWSYRGGRCRGSDRPQTEPAALCHCNTHTMCHWGRLISVIKSFTLQVAVSRCLRNLTLIESPTIFRLLLLLLTWTFLDIGANGSL